MGLYLEGSVSPPLSGVNIRIIAARQSSNAPLHKGDLAETTETRADGSFIVGPLYDDTTYSIEASKVCNSNQNVEYLFYCFGYAYHLIFFGH